MKRNHILLLGLLALGACFSGSARPRDTIRPTGEPLHIVDDIVTWTSVTKEKVGEAEHKDSAGNIVGKTAVFAERERQHAMPVWYPAQGRVQLTDDEMLRISGAAELYQRTLESRAKGETWRKRGMIAIVGGTGAALFSALTTNNVLRYGLAIAGIVGGTAGYGMFHYGNQQVGGRLIDRGEAEAAAAAYNQRLGVNVTGSF